MKEIRKVILKTLIAVWSLSGGSLSLLLSGFATDVPIAKYVFTFLKALDGTGMELLFVALGVGTIFYLVRNRQKKPWVSAVSFFFALCTIFGISYAKTDSWDCIFLFGNQLIFAGFIALGYYFLYKNIILFFDYVFEKNREWLSVKAQGKLGKILFEEYPFLGPLVFIVVTGLPWIVAFFPGTLQWDAHAQLWMSMGVVKQTSHHPVFISNFMWGCIKLGRVLFGSDSVGLCLYTIPQFIVQSLVFSYVLIVMKRLKTPILFRWGALFLWAVFPYFQIWGLTMVKDTPYYIGFVLFVTVIVDVVSSSKVQWKHYVLVLAASAVLALSRNDGRYVICISLLMILFGYRKYWRVFALGLVTCVVLLFVQEKIYMPAMGIGKGATGEMLSVPLLQTARYLRDHYGEVTQEEAAVLQSGFEVELSEIGSMYHPEISDSIKSNFVDNPSSAYLKEYFKVWFAQFKKHPDTYIQAFFNHIYGYFYPNCPNYGAYLTTTYIGNSEHWQDGYLDMKFAMKNNWLREVLRHTIHTTEKMPVLSLLYGCGIYTYILIGGSVRLLAHKKRRELLILVPVFSVLLICLVSPVNGYLRYMMPIMASLPMWASWCYSNIGRNEESAANEE